MTTLQTLLFTPLIAALVARLLARQPQLMAAAGALTSGVLWLWLRTVEPVDTAVPFWGQPLLLTPQNQQLLLFLLAGLFILFALSAFFAAGDWFVAGGLMGFSFLAGSLLVRPFAVAVALLLLAAGVFSFTLQSGQAGSVRGSFRYLLAMVLAAPLLLILNWQLEAQSVSFLLPANQFAALAALLLLAGFPFHIWLQGVVNESAPLPLVLVVGLVPIVPLSLLFQLFTVHPNLLDAAFLQLIWLSGSLTLLVAGVLALTAVHLKRAIANVLLLDMALVVLCLTLPEQTGWETAVTLQLGRFGSLLLLAVGWELLKRYQAEWPPNGFPVGLGRQSPPSLALFALGLFSLLGLPFTLGFAGHWRLLTAVGQLSSAGAPWWLAAVALLSLGLGAAGALRVVALLLQAGEAGEETAVSDPFWLQIAVGLIFLIAVWLAIFPQQLARLAF